VRQEHEPARLCFDLSIATLQRHRAIEQHEDLVLVPVAVERRPEASRLIELDGGHRTALSGRGLDGRRHIQELQMGSLVLGQCIDVGGTDVSGRRHVCCCHAGMFRPCPFGILSMKHTVRSSSDRTGSHDETDRTRRRLSC